MNHSLILEVGGAKRQIQVMSLDEKIVVIFFALLGAAIGAVPFSLRRAGWICWPEDRRFGGRVGRGFFFLRELGRHWVAGRIDCDVLDLVPVRLIRMEGLEERCFW